jgi:capsular exopolysaccharide synthesis family protein
MQRQEPETKAADLRGFLGIARRRIWWIALVAVLVTVAAVGLIAQRTPIYTSKAEVEVRPLTAGEPVQSFNGFVDMDTEAARVTQEPVAALAAPTLGLDPNSPSDLETAATDVSVSVPANTTYLEISCARPSPESASGCASAFADAYIKYRIEDAKSLYDGAAVAAYQQIQKATDRITQLRDAEATAAPEDQAQIQLQIQAQYGLIAAAQTRALSLPVASPTAAVLSRSAELPRSPSNKGFIFGTIIAALLGLALGLCLALILDRLDDRLEDPSFLEEALGAPTLAVIPAVKDWGRVQGQGIVARGRSRLANWRQTPMVGLVALNDPHSPVAEAYRIAPPVLSFMARLGHVQAIAVVSAGQGEGKSTTTANLGVALATSGKRVATVSCDLRKPSLHLLFQRDNTIGLSDVLAHRECLDDVLQETDVEGLSIVSSGPAPDNPAELLGSDEMNLVLTDLRSRFDFVLLDTPPALAVADALALAPHTDGALIVADASKTSRTSIVHLKRQFERVGCRILGGVINRFNPKRVWRYPSDDSYYRGVRGDDPQLGGTTRTV